MPLATGRKHPPARRAAGGDIAAGTCSSSTATKQGYRQAVEQRQADAGLLHGRVVPLLPPDGRRGLHPSAGREPVASNSCAFWSMPTPSRQVCRQFQVTGYPTIQFLSPRGAPLERDRRQEAGTSIDDGHAGGAAKRGPSRTAEDAPTRRILWQMPHDATAAAMRQHVHRGSLSHPRRWLLSVVRAAKFYTMAAQTTQVY